MMPCALNTFARLRTLRRASSLANKSLTTGAGSCNSIRCSSSNSSGSGFSADLSFIGLDRIRNFSIVAHVDHGKSTLADRILEHAGAVDRSGDNRQILDKLDVERERGITVKAQTASVLHRVDGKEYLLNLIDTPGHVDFSAEVSRSLLASQGVLLLVDANQGIQAQTVSNFYLAFAQDKTIVPVLNKIDLPGADVVGVTEQLGSAFDIEQGEVLLASAKTGEGIAEILDAVVDRVPPPSQDVYGNK